MSHEHAAKTLFADPVVYFPPTPADGVSKPHVAFVMKTHDDDPHMGCLVFYCPATHTWKEAYNVKFGKTDTGDAYFVNQGDDCC